MSDAVGSSVTGKTGPIADVRRLLDSAGVSGRRLRTVIRLLTEHPRTLASLVQASAVDRRTVETVLRALGEDLVETGDQLLIAQSRVEEYRQLIDYPQLVDTEPVDPLEPRLAKYGDLVARMEGWIAEAPRSRRALDHVSATAETAVRRALWLDATFDLDRARLLCAGDHDLTSLALANVNPRIGIMVVDVDDAILEYIDSKCFPAIRSLYSDFRFGIPGSAREWADVVFTDPPYTPEGVGLFLARGVDALRDHDHARLVMAYGYSPNHPALGLKVQQAITSLHLAYEAIVPAFNRYDGAQAVGSSSDLYVLRPTARTFRSIEAAGRSTVKIYTHGSQSLESESTRFSADMARTVREAAAGPDGIRVTLLGPGWRSGEALGLQDVFSGQLPATIRASTAVAVDLTDDPGSWLARVLLATDVQRLAVLVSNSHPDLTSAAAQRSLVELVGTKYRLKLRRSTPGPRHAIVEADRVATDDLDGWQRAVRSVVDRAHGKVGNTWREALIRLAADQGTTLTKNDARARIRTTDIPPDTLNEQLLALPRYRIVEVIRAIASSSLALLEE